TNIERLLDERRRGTGTRAARARVRGSARQAVELGLKLRTDADEPDKAGLYPRERDRIGADEELDARAPVRHARNTAAEHVPAGLARAGLDLDRAAEACAAADADVVGRAMHVRAADLPVGFVAVGILAVREQRAR